MKKKLPYILLAPMMIIMGVLVFYPVIATFIYSLKRWKLTEPGNIKYVGIKNYKDVLMSESFRYSLTNTVIILATVVALTVVFGVALSIFLNVEKKGSAVFMAVAILPWALPPYVNGVLWKFIFHSGYGFLNKLLLTLGVIDAPVEWLSRRIPLLIAVAVVVTWRSIPFMAIVCLAGQKALPRAIYEAARVDGASDFQMFRDITLPLIKPFIGIGITSTSITAINVFDEIVALSGMSNLGKNIIMESYLTTFSFLDFGKGSAVTYIVLTLSGILGIAYIRTLGKEVEY